MVFFFFPPVEVAVIPRVCRCAGSHGDSGLCPPGPPLVPGNRHSLLCCQSCGMLKLQRLCWKGGLMP